MWRRRSPLPRPRCSRRSCTSGPAVSHRFGRNCRGWGSRCGMQPELRATIVQDADSGRVLMLAWMDDEAVRLTRERGEAHFFSRSRNRLWHKGETSGNTLAVEELSEDCDGDAILLRVRPAGPACHTGSMSCFAPWLWRVGAERAPGRPPGAYVTALPPESTEAAARKEGGGGGEAAAAGA